MSLDVSLAIDGAAAAEALAPHIPGLERCTPRHVKYEPGHHCHVLYDLVIDGACTAGHLMLLRPRRAERLWSRLLESRLPERAGVPAYYVGELAAVLQLYPIDLRLPGLVEASAGAELVRYKPGRRAVLRYRLGERVVYGKLRADDAGKSHMAVAGSLIAAGVATPTPLEYRPDLRMTVHAEAPGTRLADKRGADLEAWMEPVADALARLHATSIPALPEFSVERELEDLRVAAEAAALVRWSSLPFRALEPDWPAAIEQRLRLADRCLTAYRRRSATAAA